MNVNIQMTDKCIEKKCDRFMIYVLSYNLKKKCPTNVLFCRKYMI